MKQKVREGETKMAYSKDDMELWVALALLRAYQDKRGGLPDEVVEHIEEKYKYTIGKRAKR